ncbi:hypothetical protein [Streptomyces sp. NPDC002769]|uniref:hypothetical protein n=1 Tax=Streptomyces sp. NPDC002769 TaxID=3154542 RepID=UPI00331664F9
MGAQGTWLTTGNPFPFLDEEIVISDVQDSLSEFVEATATKLGVPGVAAPQNHPP